MTSERIKQIQALTGLPDSISVKQALLQVWNECAQESKLSAELQKQQFIDFHVGVMKLGLIAEGDQKWHECYESPIRRIAEKYYDESFKPEFKP